MFGIETTYRARFSKVQRVAPLVLTALLCCTAGFAQVIEQFPIPSRPISITLGPDGAMWFTQGAPQIGRIDASGVVTQFPIPNGAHAIAAGSDGNLWVTTRAAIGRLTVNGAFTLFPISGNLPYEITSGADGNLWFTNDVDPLIGRITTSGVITEFPLPTSSSPRDITAGPDGNVWFTKPAADKIGRITASGVVTEFATPTSHVWPWRIAGGPNGNVWFTTSYPGLGQITSSGAITEFSVPDVLALVGGIDGNLWAAGFGTLKRIRPDGLTISFSVPTGTNEFFATAPDIATAPDGSIWIADYMNAQIVRFALPTTCTAEPTALCLNGRFRVTASWRTRDGASGQGRGVALTADSGYFWFFDAANVEVLVKVLNGCGVNSRYWTFAAGLTDVEVTLTVTDTQTGAVKTYTNPQGSPFPPIQETSAFSTCP